MIAIDTNVLVRILTRDDPAQTATAAALLAREDTWVPKTVLLETEWVLRYTYELDRGSILQAFLKLLGYRKTEFEDRAAVLRALDWYREGLDLADALHLASSGGAQRFATFDAPFAKSARKCQATPAVQLLRGTEAGGP